MMGAGKWIARVFQLLMEKHPSVSYYPEPAKLYQFSRKRRKPRPEQPSRRLEFL
jgi:hypothetical protein